MSPAGAERGRPPLPVALEHTLAFVTGALPRPPARVLEVGAGNGALAAQLATRGYGVTTIDLSAEACEAARARGGFAVVEGDFLAYDGTAPDTAPFDAVLFTRSLHHIHPLAEAVDRAVALLPVRGVVIVEDFSCERADRATLAWIAGAEARLLHEGLLPTEGAPLFGPDPVASWIAFREKHAISEGGEVTAALAARLHVERLESAPYPYRYFADKLRGPDPTAAGRALFAEEERLIASRDIAAIGLRIVTRRRG